MKKHTANTQKTFLQAKKAAIKAAKRTEQANHHSEQIIREKKRRGFISAASLTNGRYDGELARDESGAVIGVYRRSGHQITFHPIKNEL
ncbi:hypothetical protein [Methylovulum psychrotolerans]|nr:hypothetical protein [Methylovulum psychrotolerans]